MPIDRTRLDEFTTAYIEAALWSSNDEADESGGEPLDKNYDLRHFSEETLESMVADCKKFQGENWTDIKDDPRQAGIDFWLTRNRHGAGFWDGGWSKAAGKRLTDAAHRYGESTLYVGDEGLIHSS